MARKKKILIGFENNGCLFIISFFLGGGFLSWIISGIVKFFARVLFKVHDVIVFHEIGKTTQNVVFILWGIFLIWLFTKITNKYKYLCSNCGNSVENTSKICPYCGAHFEK